MEAFRVAPSRLAFAMPSAISAIVTADRKRLGEWESIHSMSSGRRIAVLGVALKLARDPALLAEIKGKLVRNRNTYPLFNTVRFTRHIEAAYTTMWETWQRTEAAKSFSVEPIE